MINALRYALTAVTVATVPVVSSVVTTPSAPTKFEQPTTTGIVRALMTTESNESGSSTLGYVLDTGVAKIELPADEPAPATLGARVTLNGGVKAVESGDATVKASAAVTTEIYAPIAARNLVVVPVTWEGAPFPAERQSAMQTTLVQLDSWWSSASAGIENLSIRSLPITTIPVPSNCDFKAMETAAKSAVGVAALTTWATNITVILPENSGCWWAGLGYMPGFVTWINAINIKVMIHELGHNMGLPHANTCFQKETLSLVNMCDESEYGDQTDPMGSAWSVDRYSYGAEFLTRIGWLPQSQQTTWTGTATSYTLVPLDDTSSGGLRGIRINGRGSLDSTSPGDYWLQFRAFSENSSPKPGVHLTVSPTKEFELSAAGQNSDLGTSTWLCDLTPGDIPWGSPGWNSFGFLLNTPWSDPSGLFTVTVTAVTANDATLTIKPARTLPTAPSSVSTEVLTSDSTPDGRIKVSWTTALSAPTSGFGEPVAITATINGTANSCTASVRAKFCIISGAPRARELDILTVSKNYTGASASAAARTQAIPVTPPTGTLTSSSTSTSATFTLAITDTGGAPIYPTRAITLSNGQACAVDTNLCTISGLLPRARYTATSKLENSAGARTISAIFTTLSQKPVPPTVTAVLVDGVPTATVTVQPIDTSNVDFIGFFCSYDKSWRQTPFVGGQITSAIASAVSDDYCWVHAVNTTGYSNGTLVKFRSLSDKPITIPGETTTTNPGGGNNSGGGGNSGGDNGSQPTPVISAKTTRVAGGTQVRVTWKVTNGDLSRVTVSKIAGRICRRTGRNTCVAKNVRRGRMTVTLAMPGAKKITLRTPR
jgi:hypothetical protein